ncbi:MAG: hypothetical protein IJI45_11765 [Anaerolineaceae bacterium]|nr:hypothetical protein [Anaerolineaceae bacterium]
MKNNLKNALDTALRDLDWHGEEEVLRAVRAKKRPGISLGRIPARTLVLAVILMTMIISTALALGITFSIRYQIQRQAAEVIKSTYGLTDEMLDLFTYKRENTENGWIASFEANAIHQKELGFYTVEKEADGTLSVTWSNDNADQELVASGELTSPAWGAKQLARIIPFYRQRMDRWKNVQNMDDLTLEEKAALDAPLLEVQEIGLLINIVPEKDDISVEMAKEIAMKAVTEKYGVSEEALAKKKIDISFYLYGGTDRREYRISMDDLDSSYVINISSPDGNVTYCRWMVSEENRTLPEGDLSLYAEAAQEYVTTGAFDLLDAAEKSKVAARYEAAGLGDLLPKQYILPKHNALSEKEAIEKAAEAAQATFGLKGNWQSLFQVRSAMIKEQDRSLWQITWLPYNMGNWHWPDVDKLGEYKATLSVETGEIFSCEWSLLNVDTGNYTEETWGQAQAYSADMLPWVLNLLEQAQQILEKYPVSTNLDEMSPEDRAAYDALFRSAGYDLAFYRNTLPNEKDITQEDAAALALEAIQTVYQVDGSALVRGEAFHESFSLWVTDEGNTIRVWIIYYWNDPDAFTVAVNAENGEIEQIWHDDLSVGNG